MICVNLFGGAGIGKSTVAAEIFTELKKKGFKTELVGEFAKDLVYQNSTHLLGDQLWVFANQAHRLRNLAKSHVEVAVCDSPLLLSITYQRLGAEPKSFSTLVKEEFENYKNINYLIPRNDDFWKKDSRHGDIMRAKIMDGMIERVLESYTYKTIPIEEIKYDVMEVVTNERLSRERTEPRRHGSLHDVRRL